MVENQPAEFICQYSRPVKARWRKNGQPLHADGRRVVVEQDWNVARLYISRVSTEDGGTYACEAEGTCVVASLYVEGEVSLHMEKAPILRVSSAPSYLSFICLKNSFKGVKHSGLLKSLLIDIFILVTAKPITIVQGLENVETFNGGEALFECALSRPESKDCHWFLDGKPVKESPSAEIVSFENGRRHLLLLKELSLKDACMVTFKAGTASTSAQLSVKGEASNECFKFL